MVKAFARASFCQTRFEKSSTNGLLTPVLACAFTGYRTLFTQAHLETGAGLMDVSSVYLGVPSFQALAAREI
jgi:hypothetical protein